MEWIMMNWTIKVMIRFYARGFFVVIFDKPEERQWILEKGP